MEHMANYLPFKFRMETELIRLNEDGMLDLDYYESLLKKICWKGKTGHSHGSLKSYGICDTIPGNG